ncbi:MAG: hypothetical protein HQ510_10135 [Candidatus Marinimicrobia bacterium]|nr:hypothetical protein [Candidatus Neomarinimicrobiota bacterium]
MITKLMIKYSSGLLLIGFIFSNNTPFSVVSEQSGITKLKFETGTIDFNSIGNYTRLSAPSKGRTMDYGMPELPLFSTFFQLESGISYSVSYEVIRSHTITEIDLFPTQDSNTDWNEGDMIQLNADFYQTGGTYPESNLFTSEILTMRNLELMEISLIPFQYDSQSKELLVFDEVEIHISESGVRELTLAHTLPPSRTFEQLYESLIVNYNRTVGQEYQQPAVLYICGGGSNGAIIHPAFLQLVQWRRQRGFIVYTASTAETGSFNSQIKNYIQDAYENFNPPPEFVGLVGDDGGGFSIPTYQESWSGYGGDGDHPYSQLNGTDLLPEVLIGRISVSNGTDLSVVVNKTISYEKAVDTSSNWMEKAALVGDWSNSGLSVVISNEYIQNIMENFGMEDVRTRLGQSPYPSWMESQLNEGILYFNYRGWLGNSGFSSGNINNANNGYKTPFVTFITCGTGSFSSTSIAESFLRAGTVANPKGGVAAIGTATSGTHTAFNNIVDMGVYDGIFSKGIESAGGALANGKLALYQTYPSNPSDKVSIFTHWNNLMGDPALQLWTDTPQDFIIDHPESIGIGTNYLEVQVLDESGGPVEEAVVTLLSANDAIFISKYTDETGIVQIDIEDLDYSGTVGITVTRRNFIPYESIITIVASGPVANIVNEDIQVDDSLTGNDDGMLNPGETIILRIPVRNFGTEEIYGLQAHLESGSDKIEIIDGDVMLGVLSISDELIAEFTVVASVTLINMEDLNLIIDLNDVSLNHWSSLVHVYPYAANLNVTGYSVQNGYMLTPGTSREVTVSLSNSGTIGASGVTAVVTSPSSLIEIENGSFTFGNLAPGATISSPTTMTVTTSNDIVNGSIFYLNFQIQSGTGYDAVYYLRVQIGVVTVVDPLGPDSHGYYIYDSGDLGYSFAPQYNWIEIDPDYGGSGTSLGMNDNGNGNPNTQTSAHVPLPFTFSFYGIDYDDITVSTNGWISFGNSELESFRNYPIPGAGGPSPMVAVFWDDMTTSSGDVLKYYDEANDMMIIEWSNLQTYDHPHSESFQILLFNGLTPTGDGEMIINYKDFNNTSSGSYSGYTPIHGAYCTIGIENHLGNEGLQYTFNNEYPVTSMTLGDETSLLITTRLPAAMLMGDANQDGEVNVLDITVIISFILNAGNLEPIGQFVSDMNDDGGVNILDVIHIINLILDN